MTPRNTQVCLYSLLHQLNATLYEVVQRLACEHVVLQQSDVDELLYGVVTGCILGKDTLLVALCRRVISAMVIF